MSYTITLHCDVEGEVYQAGWSWWNFFTAVRLANKHSNHGHETTMNISRD